MSNNLNSNLDVLFSKMENFISSKTVIGEPVVFGDVVLLPLVDVSFGVGAGAVGVGEEAKDKKETSGGGLGASIQPSAVVVISGGNVQLVNVKNQDSLNKLIDMAPTVLSKLNLSGLFKKDKKEEPGDDIATELDTTEGFFSDEMEQM